MNPFKCRPEGSVKRCPGRRRLDDINRSKLLSEGAGFRVVCKVVGNKSRTAYLKCREKLSLGPLPTGNKVVPVVAIDDGGNVVARYPSIKVTAEYGYCSDSVSSAITRGIKYAGLYWRKESTRVPCL